MSDALTKPSERLSQNVEPVRADVFSDSRLWGKKAAKWLTPFCLLFLSACTICPPSTDSWSGDIAPEPQIQKAEAEDDDSKAGLWSWSDGAGRWEYSARDKPNAPGLQWVYEPRAIAVRVNAAEQLNLFMGQPHTLSLKVIQLTNPAIVSELRESPFGLSDLMAAKGKELSESIVREDIVAIAPGSSRTLVLPREQDVRYIAFVAGYFEMESKASVRIVPVPSVQARVLPCYDALPWPVGDPPPPEPDDVPARLKIWLDMAPAEIKELKAQAY